MKNVMIFNSMEEYYFLDAKKPLKKSGDIMRKLKIKGKGFYSLTDSIL